MATGTTPCVSVLLPLDEEAACAVAAAESALACASMRELVVVHTGAAADLAAAIHARDPERVRILAHEDHGVGRLLGLAATVARGEWLVALSPRETLRERILEREVERLRLRPETAGVVTGVRGGESLVDVLFGSEMLPGGAAVLRTDMVRAVGGYDPTLRVACHLDLWLRLLECGELLLNAETLVEGPSLGRVAGEPEPEVARVERAVALGQAVASLRPSQFAPDAKGPGEAEVRVARACAACGFPELQPWVTELVGAARAAGAPSESLVDVPRVPFVDEVASRAQVAEPPVQPPGGARAWLRVMLEVASLDRGGLENVVADLALTLPAAGVEPVVLCTQRGGERAEELRAAGVRVVVLRRADDSREIGAWLDELDVDLLNPHFSMAGIEPAAAREIPVVPTLHNAYAWVGASVLDDFRRLDPLVAGYTAVSDYVAEFSARRFGIARERICVIHNAHRVGGGSPALDRASARRELEIDEDAELVVQVGRIDPIKCQLALVDAAAALGAERANLWVWIVGDVGDPTYAARVERRIAEAGLGNVVSLLGQRADVGRLLAAADVLAMPSVVEGLSLSVIEALAVGVPAVLTRTGDAARLLGVDGSSEPAALPGALIDGPVVDPVETDGEELFRMATAENPPHAGALALALAAVLDDCANLRVRAKQRGEELRIAFAPERIRDAYVDAFARVVAVERPIGPPAISSNESDLETLRNAVADAGRGLDATYRLAHERMHAMRQAGALAYDVGGLRDGLESTGGVSEQILNKLRLTHRFREGWAMLRRKARGGPEN